MIANIESLRKEKKLTQDDAAKYLGITRQTFSKLEKGDIEPTLGQAVKLAEILGVSIDNFINTDIKTIETKKIDWDKYKQIIQFFIEHGTGNKFKITKTKLAKLCYLADFTWYYYNLEPITGLEYRKIQQGPVPDAYFATIEELFNDESINIEIKGNSHLISNKGYYKTDKLSLEEKSMLTKIAHKWKKSDTKEIVDFTHNQLPWMICYDKEIIPYGLITQEDPENVY
ncbi:MAG: helix-turn-helix domain-containing protein [Candidatus Gracilibacteria bacterium]|nr:helix-turn-helix domain-containing protein [Candidatus Gracilibacteria bacterium]